MSTLRVIPVERSYEKQFSDFLDKDRILHVFTVYDFRYMRDKTEIWVAMEEEKIVGYLLEFDKRIVHAHGSAESVAKLLDCIDLDELVFVIESHHLRVVKESFEPLGSTDSSTKGEITTYLIMKVDAETFKPMINHRVKRLRTEDLAEVFESMGDEWKTRIEDVIHKGIAFGAYDNGSLVAVATVSEILEDLSLIRGVYTVPLYRRKGFATSACSALIRELIDLGKEAMLWAAKDNLPARNVYEKIGFKRTEHSLPGFKAKRL
ncbi:MAG: GNAT family N-acetyltransferase [Candidatus Bathyarchaeia archaeon]